MRDFYKFVYSVCCDSIICWGTFCLVSLTLGHTLESEVWINLGQGVGIAGIAMSIGIFVTMFKIEAKLHKMDKSEEDEP